MGILDQLGLLINKSNEPYNQDAERKRGCDPRFSPAIVLHAIGGDVGSDSMLNSVIFIILFRNKAGQDRNRAQFLGNGSGKNTTESTFSG